MKMRMDQVYQCDKIKVNIIPSVIYLKLYIIMVVIYCCLEREYYKVLKFDVNNSSYCEISTS